MRYTMNQSGNVVVDHGLGGRIVAPPPGLGVNPNDPDCFVKCRNAQCYDSYSACVTTGDRCDPEYRLCNDSCVNQCNQPAAPAASSSGWSSFWSSILSF